MSTYDREAAEDRAAMIDPNLVDDGRDLNLSEPESSGRRKWEVCPECNGEGKVVHPGVSVWTQNDRAEDPDGFEDMMRGVYDIACPMCKGLRVVTEEMERDYAERQDDHFTRLRESGIYPGNPDYF